MLTFSLPAKSTCSTNPGVSVPPSEQRVCAPYQVEFALEGAARGSVGGRHVQRQYTVRSAAVVVNARVGGHPRLHAFVYKGAQQDVGPKTSYS